MFQKMTKIKDIFTARKFFLKKSLNISQTECQNFGLIPTHPGCGEISPNRITLLCSWFAVENEHRWRSVGPKTWSSFGIPNFYKWSLVEKKVVFFSHSPSFWIVSKPKIDIDGKFFYGRGLGKKLRK
jgi:hypothetical protein